jgi:lysozyme family protein
LQQVGLFGENSSLNNYYVVNESRTNIPVLQIGLVKYNSSLNWNNIWNETKIKLKIRKISNTRIQGQSNDWFAVFSDLRTNKTAVVFPRTNTLYKWVTCTRKYKIENFCSVEFRKVSKVYFTPLLMSVISNYLYGY